MALFAAASVDDVTVQRIASTVAMTTAAVYYHFESKDQILLEGLQQFCDEMLVEVDDLPPGDAGALVVHLLEWVERRRDRATVYFVSSVGLNRSVEALRRETRASMTEELFEHVGGDHATRAERWVVAMALVSLIESSVASALRDGELSRGLGPERFRGEVRRAAARIVG